MIRSPLRYPGGKSRAVKFLSRFLPPFAEFREPFFGGGSMMFHALHHHPAAQYWANDLNYDLFCFWQVLKSRPAEMIENIEYIKKNELDGRKLFNALLEKRRVNMSDLERAVDFFVLNRITFSGVVDSGGYSEQAFHKRFTESSIHRLAAITPHLQNIEFTHGDYRELLQKPGENVFIFLDPPYYVATKSRLYGKRGTLHQQFDHERFARDMRDCPHRWLITYDNSEYIRELFAGFHFFEWELQYGMNNYKQNGAAKGRELLVANFPLIPHP